MRRWLPPFHLCLTVLVALGLLFGASASTRSMRALELKDATLGAYERLCEIHGAAAVAYLAIGREPEESLEKALTPSLAFDLAPARGFVRLATARRVLPLGSRAPPSLA